MTGREALRGLLARDPGTWKPDVKHQAIIRNALGWLDLPEEMAHQAGRLQEFAREVKAAGFTDAVLVGMGGSSLAPDVMRRMLQGDGLRLHVLDTTCPDTILGVRRAVDLEHTLVIVSSKSGTTTEPVSLYRYFWRELKGDGGHFIAITDPGSWLEREAKARGFRAVFPGKPDVGGRYSALSNFGMVPAALMGIDTSKLLAGGRAALEDAASAASLGEAMATAALAGRDKITFLTPPELEPFGDWLEQLLAESTGKEGKGLIPVAGEPVGKPSDYGDDRFFIRFPGGADDLEPAYEAGFSNLGRAFVHWEIATAVAGAILGIDAFDQPNVQESKDITVEILKQGTVPEEATLASMDDLLSQVRPGDYVAVMAYLPPTAGSERLRAAVRRRTKAAVTFGYGPRFLHSTGQIHKGGPNTCVALQLTRTPAEDMPVPEAPYTFGTLWRAQAAGDLAALRRHGRRAGRVDLGDGGIDRLIAGLGG